jgi:hypothetical protein
VIACEDVRRRGENPLRPRPADCDPLTYDHPCAIASANSRLRPTASICQPQVTNDLQRRPRRRQRGCLCLTGGPLHSRPRFAPRHLEDRLIWGIRSRPFWHSRRPCFPVLVLIPGGLQIWRSRSETGEAAPLRGPLGGAARRPGRDQQPPAKPASILGPPGGAHHPSPPAPAPVPEGAKARFLEKIG